MVFDYLYSEYYVYLFQYFEHVEEAVWAVQVLKESGKPVAATLCIGPEGDLNGVSPGECAVRLAKAGTSHDRFLKVLCFTYFLLFDRGVQCKPAYGMTRAPWQSLRGSELSLHTIIRRPVL